MRCMRCDLAVLRDEAREVHRPAPEAIVIRLIALGIVCTPLFAGCGTEPADAANTDPDPANAAQSPTADTADPATAAAAMVGPTTGSGGSSRVTVASSASGAAGVTIDGGSESGSFATASYAIDRSANALTADITVTPAPGAAFVYFVRGTRQSYSAGVLRVQRTPGTETLVTTTSTGTVVCGNAPSDRTTELTVALDPGGQKFDVRIDGAASNCTDLPTAIGAPLTSMGLMDASNDGWGGQVSFGEPQMF